MRLFLLALAMAALPVRAAEPANFKEAVGLQLWSLREEFKKDVPGTLDLVKSYGFTQVETAGVYGLAVPEFRRQLESRGLRAVSAHFQYGALQKDIEAAVTEAKALGVKFVACPYIPHETGRFGEADARKAATDFNKWGQAFKDAGITFTYHPHGYEFRPEGDRTAFDVLAEQTNPETVFFEMDVLWVIVPGADPVKLLEKYPNRWKLMHLKDLRKGARTGVYTGKSPKEDDVPLGQGQADWPAILAAAQKCGVEHYFIEDENPAAAKQIPESLEYLKTIPFGKVK